MFTDHASGAKSKRPGLDACVMELKAGDTLVVWHLDRLGRSMPHLVNLVEELLQRGVGFRSLQDVHIDTSTAAGELMFHVFSSLAKFERRLGQRQLLLLPRKFNCCRPDGIDQRHINRKAA